MLLVGVTSSQAMCRLVDKRQVVQPELAMQFAGLEENQRGRDVVALHSEGRFVMWPKAAVGDDEMERGTRAVHLITSLACLLSASHPIAAERDVVYKPTDAPAARV